MKKLLFIILLAAAIIPFQNCKTKETTPDPIDTTPVAKVEPVNSFKFNGIKTYNLKWDSTNMYAYYIKNQDLTKILVQGYSNGTFAAFYLTIPGKKTGITKFSLDATKMTNIEITTGQGTTEKGYAFSTKAGSDMTINITSYGGVGGRVKGGFAGNLQSAGSLETADISSGFFEVRRDVDQ